MFMCHYSTALGYDNARRERHIQYPDGVWEVTVSEPSLRATTKKVSGLLLLCRLLVIYSFRHIKLTELRNARLSCLPCIMVAE